MFFTEGVIIAVLGLVAMAVPPLAGLVATVILGWLFLFAGIAGLLFTWRTRAAPGFNWSLFSGLLALLAGLVLIWNPLEGLVTLTYVLLAYFIVDGVFMIQLALSHRRELSGRWEWLLFNGVIDLLFAALVISGLPGASAWLLGLLVGIDLVIGGTSLMALAWAARR
jgi:uncharacterized membrane protein HdeD (DUF308 family)